MQINHCHRRIVLLLPTPCLVDEVLRFFRILRIIFGKLPRGLNPLREIFNQVRRIDECNSLAIQAYRAASDQYQRS
ncbi:hypothetical protein XCR_2806 [Xanthomonas campestris pv. raphani 756C]|nr:hypothetical protein XCR_2806 [Xanthomonas campestris pv. raphani 756C]